MENGFCLTAIKAQRQSGGAARGRPRMAATPEHARGYMQGWVIAHAKRSAVTANRTIEQRNGNPFPCTITWGG